MTIVELLKRATKLINLPELNEVEKEELKNILCYLSEWRKNNPAQLSTYPQMEIILYTIVTNKSIDLWDVAEKFTSLLDSNIFTDLIEI